MFVMTATLWYESSAQHREYMQHFDNMHRQMPAGYFEGVHPLLGGVAEG